MAATADLQFKNSLPEDFVPQYFMLRLDKIYINKLSGYD
jgi:hypothetical protein